MSVKNRVANLVFVRLSPYWSNLRTTHPTAHRLLSKASRAFFPWSERIWMKSEGGIAAGLYFKLNPRFEKDFLGGSDDKTQAIWTENLTPGKVFYDVGSHIGVFAVSGARLVGPKGAVYAFEPDPANVRLIKENANRNSLPVDVTAAAAWKFSGKLQFAQAPGSDPGRMGGHLVSEEAESSTISVNAVCLDDFAQTHRPPNFIKLDVEGAEAEVIEGARNTILEHKPNLLIEIHNEDALRRVSALLAEYGYNFECVIQGDRQYLATPKSGVSAS